VEHHNDFTATKYQNYNINQCGLTLYQTVMSSTHGWVTFR